MEKNIKIVLIGAGNVGFHLGKNLHNEGYNIIQVFSRKAKKVNALAELIEAKSISSFSKISKQADLYIIAVSDNAIDKVAKSMNDVIGKNNLVVHTSGATPSKILKKHFKNFGSFYPLQTFSISREINFSTIPICIDANTKTHFKILKSVAEQLSEKVYHINDEQRSKLHVAAVFVNNFSNNLFTIGEVISKKENLSFEILKPLIEETVNKIKDHSPTEMQTGPAIRNDIKTIESHLEYLKKEFPEFIDVYQTMTQSIKNNRNKK